MVSKFSSSNNKNSYQVYIISVLTTILLGSEYLFFTVRLLRLRDVNLFAEDLPKRAGIQTQVCVALHYTLYTPTHYDLHMLLYVFLMY